MHFDDRRRSGRRLNKPATINPFLDGDMRLSFELKVALFGSAL